jgi:hypothetical protein
VIKESAELALSWFKTHSYDLGITSERVQDPLWIPEAMIDMRLHLPAGPQKKDRPPVQVSPRYADVLFSPPIRVPERWAGLCGDTILNGQTRAAHYGSGRHGACLLRQPPLNFNILA